MCVRQETINQVEESEVNFVELVHSLLENSTQRKYFFQVRCCARLNTLSQEKRAARRGFFIFCYSFCKK